MATETATERVLTDAPAHSPGVVESCRPHTRSGAARVLERAREALARLCQKGQTGAAPLCGTPIGEALPPPAGGEYTFAFLGDSRDNNGVLARVIRSVAGRGCAFALHAGDLTAHGEKRSYRELVATVLQAAAGRLAVYPVIGNHDRNSGILGGKRQCNYRQFFGEPSYVLPYGPDAFVVVDSSTKRFCAEDVAALEPVLASARGWARHVFVISHTPPIDPRAGARHCLPPEDAARFTALMRRHGVAMVFSSHIHGYWQTAADGVPLVISGGAGSRLAAGQRHHWVRVEVAESGVRVQEEPVEDSRRQ